MSYSKSLNLYDVPVFSKVVFSSTEAIELPINSEACFTYFLEAENQLLLKEPKLHATKEHAILSVCGISMGEALHQPFDGEVSVFIVHFHPQVLKRIYNGSKPSNWKELESPVTEYIVQVKANRLIGTYVDGMQDYFTNEEVLTEDILILKLKEIILLLLQSDRGENVRSIMKSLFSERTFTFKEVIEAYVYKDISIENLAMLTHTSVSTFKREFKKIYEEPPASYLLNRKLEKIAQVILLSDDPLHQVAYTYGLSNPAHFSRVFKEKFHKTPSEYRNDPI